MRTPKLLVTLLVIGMTVTGCSAVSGAAPVKTPQSTPTVDASKALDTVPLASLLPTAHTASTGVGVSLNADGKPESTVVNTATPRPTDGLTRCELAFNETRSFPFTELATALFDGSDGRYSANLLRYESDSDAVAYLDAIARIGKYCPTQAGSGVTAWDSGIPETAGFVLTDSTTSYGTAIRKGRIVAFGSAPTPDSATKMLQLQIRILAAVK